MLRSLLNARTLPRRGLSQVAALAGQVPGYSLYYDNCDQVRRWLDTRTLRDVTPS